MSHSLWGREAPHVGRAPRFALREPLRYRPAGAARWSEGRIENISRSGVLFWCPQPLDVDTQLEVSFTLPTGARAPAILCRGRVVRTVRPLLPDRAWASGLAVTIRSYRFVRPGATGARALPARAEKR